MPIGYLYMILALLSWAVLGILYKLAELRNCRPLMINLLISFWSSAFLWARETVIGKSIFQVPLFVVLLALFFGVNGAVATITVQHALKRGKLSTTWLVINMAAGASTLGAVVIYHEPVTFRKSLALIMMGLAMILLWKDMQQAEAHRRTEARPPNIVSERHP